MDTRQAAKLWTVDREDISASDLNDEIIKALSIETKDGDPLDVKIGCYLGYPSDKDSTNQETMQVVTIEDDNNAYTGVCFGADSIWYQTGDAQTAADWYLNGDGIEC